MLVRHVENGQGHERDQLQNYPRRGRREEDTASSIALLQKCDAIKKIIVPKEHMSRRAISVINPSFYRARSKGETRTESPIALLQERDAIKKDPSSKRERWVYAMPKQVTKPARAVNSDICHATAAAALELTRACRAPPKPCCPAYVPRITESFNAVLQQRRAIKEDN